MVIRYASYTKRQLTEQEKKFAGVVKTYSDHRMAMAFALIGLRVDGIIIDDYECCAKTFEDYFQVLDRATRE